MLQDRVASEANYRRFIERVRDTQEVWGLRSDEGWAYCISNEYEDTDVLVFWSDRAYARGTLKESGVGTNLPPFR